VVAESLKKKAGAFSILQISLFGRQR